MSFLLLSIIIPYYNLNQWLLKRCLDSIIEQLSEEDNYEIIIIDDGSYISLENFVKSYNNNIIYFRQTNKGLSGARNTGLELARGEYIQFIDADDYLFENTLIECLTLLKKYTPALLSFNWKYCYEEKREYIKQSFLRCKIYDTGSEYMYTHNLRASVCLYIFKKSIPIENNFHFTENIFHEDEEFTSYLYFFSSKVISTNLIVYAYYQREGSITKNNSLEHLMIRFSHLKEIIVRLKNFCEQSTYTELQQKGLERKINFLVCDYIISMVRNHYPLSLINNELKELQKMGFYPLPARKYSYKYTLFRWLTYWKSNIRLLYIIDLLRTKIRRR